MENPKFLLIQATKMKEGDVLRSNNFFLKKGHHRAVLFRGASGGIDTLWDEAKFELVQDHLETYWIFTQLRHKELINLISLFNIYVPINFSEMKQCWDGIGALAHENYSEKYYIGRRSESYS